MWLVDPLEAIYPDTNELKSYGNSWSADFARGSFADMHIIVESPIGTELSIEVSDGGNNLNDYLSELIAVPVEENTGLDSRTEQFKGVKNPYVIRRAPFHIYEVIMPF